MTLYSLLFCVSPREQRRQHRSEEHTSELQSPCNVVCRLLLENKDHHFYITFKTRAPGVSIPKHLLERFPDEMTIVIQHRFWDLKVEDDNFTVVLSFGGVPATLHVPFAAVTQFHDPAVEFALTFQANADEAPREEHEQAGNDMPEAEG